MPALQSRGCSRIQPLALVTVLQGAHDSRQPLCRCAFVNPEPCSLPPVLSQAPLGETSVPAVEPATAAQLQREPQRQRTDRGAPPASPKRRENARVCVSLPSTTGPMQRPDLTGSRLQLSQRFLETRSQVNLLVHLCSSCFDCGEKFRAPQPSPLLALFVPAREKSHPLRRNAEGSQGSLGACRSSPLAASCRASRAACRSALERSATH